MTEGRYDDARLRAHTVTLPTCPGGQGAGITANKKGGRPDPSLKSIKKQRQRLGLEGKMKLFFDLSKEESSIH